MNVLTEKTSLKSITSFFDLNKKALNVGATATIILGFAALLILCLLDKYIISIILKVLDDLIMFRMPLCFKFFSTTSSNSILGQITSLFVLKKSELVDGSRIFITLGSVLPVFLFGILMGLVYVPFELILNWAKDKKTQTREFHITFFMDSFIRSLFLSLGKPEVSSCIFLRLFRNMFARPNKNGVLLLAVKDILLGVCVSMLFIFVESSSKTALVFPNITSVKTSVQHNTVRQVLNKIMSARQFSLERLNVHSIRAGSLFFDSNEIFKYDHILLEQLDFQRNKLVQACQQIMSSIQQLEDELFNTPLYNLRKTISTRLSLRRARSTIGIINTRLGYIAQTTGLCKANPQALLLDVDAMLADKEHFLTSLKTSDQQKYKYSRHGITTMLTTFVIWSIVLRPKQLSTSPIVNGLLLSGLSYTVLAISEQVINNYEMIGLQVLSDYELLNTVFEKAILLQNSILQLFGSNPVLCIAWAFRHSVWLFLNDFNANKTSLKINLRSALSRVLSGSVSLTDVKKLIGFAYSLLYSFIIDKISNNVSNKCVWIAMVQSMPQTNVAISVSSNIIDNKYALTRLLSRTTKSIDNIISLQLGSVLHNGQSEFQVKCNSEEFNLGLFIIGLSLLCLLRVYETSSVFEKFTSVFSIETSSASIQEGVLTASKIYTIENGVCLSCSAIIIIMAKWAMRGVGQASIVSDYGITKVLALFLLKKLYGIIAAIILEFIGVEKDTCSDAVINSFSGKKLMITALNDKSQLMSLVKIVPLSCSLYLFKKLEAL